MNNDTRNLFDSYKLIVEKKKSSKEKEKSKTANPYAVCTTSTGRKNKKKYNKCVKDVKTAEEANEEIAITSETRVFLDRLAARLLADQGNGYTNEDIYRLKEIASKF